MYKNMQIYAVRQFLVLISVASWCFMLPLLTRDPEQMSCICFGLEAENKSLLLCPFFFSYNNRARLGYEVGLIFNSISFL